MGKRLIRLTESDLHKIVKESVSVILERNNGELSWLDKIERALPWTDAHKLHKRAKEIRARREAENAAYEKRRQKEAEQERIRRQEAARRREDYIRQQSAQQQQSQRNDIYSQTIHALNRNDYSFFNGREELQGVLASLYNGKKITYREYDRGLEWIGRGYKYPSGQSDGLW